MHSPSQYDLLRERRFAPFFWTQFLGAGNDNIYKNALIIFVAFEAAQMTSLDGGLVVAIHPHGPIIAGVVAVVVAIAGYLVSRAIPVTPPVSPDLRINW